MRVPPPLPSTLSSRAFSLSEAAANNVAPRRLRAKDLTVPTRGARLQASIALELVQRARAYQLAAPDAVVSHVTAAVLWGFWLPRDLQAATTIHLTRPSAARAVRRAGAVGHKGELAADETVGGSHVVSTSPERTWCDLAGILSLDELVMAGDFLLRRRNPLATPEGLAAAAARMAGRRGARLARQALVWIRPRTDSPKETELRLLLLRAGLPEPAINCAVLDEYGLYVEEPDLTYPRHRIALQYDGGHHITEVQRRWDIGRDEAIIELGWRVLKFTQYDLQVPFAGAEPLAVSRTRAALLERGWTPDPSPTRRPGVSRRPGTSSGG